MRTILNLIGVIPCIALAAGDWPGLPPDCWSDSRMVHSAGAYEDHWRKNTKITIRKAEKPKQGEHSPNKGYLFAVEGGRPSGRITIYAEKNHLVDIDFSELFGLSDVRWISEKLIFVRAWWGRIGATDLIFDVEKEKFIYAEDLTDGYLAHQQYLESCLVHGCRCIEKK